MVKRYSAYSEAEDQIIIVLRNRGLSIREISEHLPGRTEISVRNRVSNLIKSKKYGKEGIKILKQNFPYSEAEDQIIIDLRNKGFSIREISEHLPGRSKKSVDTRLLKLRWSKKVR